MPHASTRGAFLILGILIIFLPYQSLCLVLLLFEFDAGIRFAKLSPMITAQTAYRSDRRYVQDRIHGSNPNYDTVLLVHQFG